MMLLSKNILGSLLLIVPVFVYACPELQGSYKVEQRADLYIQKQSDGSYLAMIESEDHQPQFLSVIRPEAKELKEQGYTECTAIIKGLGLLMPSDKNKTYQVTSESQNYQIGKKPGTPFVIMYMAGFQSDVFGVDKISETIPQAAVDRYHQGGN